MKQVLTSAIARSKRLMLPAGVMSLGIMAVAASQIHPGNAKLTATENQPVQADSPMSESPAPTASPTITVDGRAVTSGSDGSTHVVTTNGQTSVNLTGGQAVVITTDDSKRGDTSNKTSGNVSVKLDSSSNGGTNRGSIRTYGVNASNDNSSTSFSSTSVYSSGSNQVNVSH